MEMTIPSLSVPREQATALPARTPETDGTLTAEQDPTLLKTEPTKDFASVLSSLFPTSSSEDVEKNGDQQELSERGQSDHNNTSLPRNKEEASVSLPTLAPTPNASPLLLSSLVYTDKNGEAPEVPLLSNNSEQEYRLPASVALGVPLKMSGHRARPNGREIEALSAPFGDQGEHETSVSVGQEEGVSSLSVDVSLPILPVSDDFAIPGGANTKEFPPTGNDTYAQSVEIVFSGIQLPKPTNPEPISAQPSYEQGYGGSFAAHAAPKIVEPYAVTHAIEPSLTPVQQNEQQDEVASAVVPVGTIPQSPTNDETQQDSVRLSSSPSVHLLNAAVFQPEYPSENGLSVSEQFRGITTSGEPNGQGQLAPTFVNQVSNKPLTIYTDGYGTAHGLNIVREESLRSLTMDSQITDAEGFAVRRTRAQDRNPSHSTGLEDLRTRGDGLGVVTPLPTVTQPRTMAGPMVIERVAQEIAAHIDQGKKKAVIELEPKELGRVQIDLVLEGEKVQVRIVTEAAAVSSLIQTHLLELKQALQLHSLELSTVSVDVNARGGEQGNLSYGSQQQLGRHNDNGTGAPGAQAEENTPDTRRRNDTAQSRDGVSVWA